MCAFWMLKDSNQSPMPASRIDEKRETIMKQFLKIGLMAMTALCAAWSVNAQTTQEAAPSADNGACRVEIQGNDAMRFSTDKIVVPKSCERFTVSLRHVGRMPKTVMGHNWVLTSKDDYRDVAKASAKAGAANDFLSLPDERILAHTDLIGAGEETSVTFDVAKLNQGQDYVYFCSFPGHFAMMKGSLKVE